MLCRLKIKLEAGKKLSQKALKDYVTTKTCIMSKFRKKEFSWVKLSGCNLPILFLKKGIPHLLQGRICTTSSISLVLVENFHNSEQHN